MRALVTGGASGIGEAIVERLRAEGTDVLVLDLVSGFDVADPAAWSAIEPVDLAFLNAGVLTGEGDVEALTDRAYRRTLATNVDGVVFGVRHLASTMPAGGSIVVTASDAGLAPSGFDPVYALTKHAVVGFVRSVAPQLAQRGLRINLVCPTVVDSPMVPAELRAGLVAAGTPMLGAGQVAEVALNAARSGATGQAWLCEAGRKPALFAFPEL